MSATIGSLISEMGFCACFVPDGRRFLDIPDKPKRFNASVAIARLDLCAAIKSRMDSAVHLNLILDVGSLDAVGVSPKTKKFKIHTYVATYM